MKRRDFIKKIGAGSGALAGGVVGAASLVEAPAVHAKEKVYEWKMVTTWPKNFPGLGTGANFLADTIKRMTGGRVNVTVYGAGELVPAFESFGAVSQGTAQMGHGASYYWKGKTQAAQFFCAVPYGLNAQEMNAWFYHGGGLALWEEIYDQFNLVPNPALNTGVQMGGWFNKQINSLEDLKGLKMRIPGLGGEVLKRLGGTPVSLPGGEIFTSLQSGAIDATEWVGPYNDKAFGLYKAAKYYYYPGWHEPGSTLECFINKDSFKEIGDELGYLVRTACRVANQDGLADLETRNNQALQSLIDDHGVELRKFPDEALKQLGKVSEEVVAEVAEKDDNSRKVYEAYKKFRSQAIQWHEISERAYYNARALSSS